MGTTGSKSQINSPTSNARIRIVDDPSGTPTDGFITLNVAQNVSLLMRTTDSTATPGTTETADSVLSFTPVANSFYMIEGLIYIDSDITTGFKSSFTIPAGASGKITRGMFDGTDVILTTDTIGTTVQMTQTSAGNTWNSFSGFIEVSTAITPITFDWAKIVDSYALKVQKGSLLRFTRKG